jgi:hypothetical protein
LPGRVAESPLLSSRMLLRNFAGAVGQRPDRLPGNWEFPHARAISFCQSVCQLFHGHSTLPVAIRAHLFCQTQATTAAIVRRLNRPFADSISVYSIEPYDHWQGEERMSGKSLPPPAPGWAISQTGDGRCQMRYLAQTPEVNRCIKKTRLKLMFRRSRTWRMFSNTADGKFVDGRLFTWSRRTQKLSLGIILHSYSWLLDREIVLQE